MTVDEYISGFPADVQKILQKVRATVRKAAPDAEEAVKYGIPTLTLNGNLVHYGAFRKHIGFYPAPQGLEEFKAELSKYKGAKGSVQFPLDAPIPYDLIARITKFRAAQQGDEKIVTKHPQGKSGRSISRKKYDQVAKAIRSALRGKELTHTELMGRVLALLEKKFDGNISWYTETVKLDLEARKEVARTASKPQRYQLAKR
jgi:uncharacterized protein YdhG (YjbR/CyaY superfamily)